MQTLDQHIAHLVCTPSLPLPPAGYCQISCGRCACPTVARCSCTDLQPPTGKTCKQYREWGACGQVRGRVPGMEGSTCLDQCALPPPCPLNSLYACHTTLQQWMWQFYPDRPTGYCQTTCGRCSC